MRIEGDWRGDAAYHPAAGRPLRLPYIFVPPHLEDLSFYISYGSGGCVFVFPPTLESNPEGPLFSSEL